MFSFLYCRQATQNIQFPSITTGQRLHILLQDRLPSPRSAEPPKVVGGEDATPSMQQLEDGVESNLGGYPDAQWCLPPKYNLAKDLPHELQGCINTSLNLLKLEPGAPAV
jgi:hypothetical protein